MSVRTFLNYDKTTVNNFNNIQHLCILLVFLKNNGWVDSWNILKTKVRDMVGSKSLEPFKYSEKYSLSWHFLEFYDATRNTLLCFASFHYIWLVFRYLHQKDPHEWTVERLVESFPTDKYEVKKVLKSKGPRSQEVMHKLDNQVSLSIFISLIKSSRTEFQ